jgi:hypothetical protein
MFFARVRQLLCDKQLLSHFSLSKQIIYRKGCSHEFTLVCIIIIIEEDTDITNISFLVIEIGKHEKLDDDDSTYKEGLETFLSLPTNAN